MIFKRYTALCLLATAISAPCVCASGAGGEEYGVASTGAVARVDLAKMIRDGFEIADTVANKDATFVMGMTGSGKSTTLAYLMGARVKKKKIAGKFVAEIEEGREGFPGIGHTLESHTLYPQTYSASGLYFVDCPGLFDTRGPEEKAAISVNFEYALRKAASKKIMVVTRYKDLVERGGNFPKVADSLSRIFRNVDSVSPSILWCITGADPELEPGDVIESITEAGLIKLFEDDAKRIALNVKAVRDGGTCLEYDGKKSRAQNILLFTEEFEAKQKAIKMLRSIVERRNLILVNPFDSGESRLAILDRLLSIPVVLDNEIHFEQDPGRKIFSDYISSTVARGLSLLSMREEALRFLSENRGSLDELERQMKTCADGMADVGKRAEEQARLLREEEGKLPMKRSAKEAKEKTRDEKRVQALALKGSNEKNYVWDKSFSESASWLGFFGWSDYTFSYDGDVFDEDLTDTSVNQGTITDIDVRGGDGVYKAEYVGGFYSDARASVKLFVRKKNMKSTKVTVQQLEKDVTNFNDEIEKLVTEMDQITQEIMRLKTTTYSSADFQRDLDRHTAAKTEKEKQLADKRVALESIERELGESVPVYFSLHQIQSAIDQAIRPGEESEHIKNLRRLVGGTGGGGGYASASSGGVSGRK